MKKIEMTEEILAAKKSSGLDWEEIAQKVSLGSVFITSACLGMNSLKKQRLQKHHLPLKLKRMLLLKKRALINWLVCVLLRVPKVEVGVL